MITNEAAESTGKRLSLSTKLLLLVVTVLVLVPVIGWFRKERAFAIQNACLSNLAFIEGAKSQAASELGLKGGDAVTSGQLSEYLKGWRPLKCGAGGVYTVNRIGVHATCNIPGHQR